MEDIYYRVASSALEETKTKEFDKAMKQLNDLVRGNPFSIPSSRKIPVVNRIIYSGDKTIVLWNDGTKTIVGCSEGETYDEFDGFTAALAKKIYGSTCAVKREIRKKSTKNSKKEN